MTRTSWFGKLGGFAAVLALSSTLALAESNSPSRNENGQPLTGTVTCSSRINHQFTCRRNETLQSCTLRCVQQGSTFALTVGNKSYLLQGDPKDLERFAGGKVAVKGLLVGDTIRVGFVSKPGDMPQTFATQEQPAMNAGQ